jgi:DNA-binding PadR family transcriptional regulator
MFHMNGRRAGCGPRGYMAVWGPTGRGGGLGGGFMMGHGRGLRGGGRDGSGGGRRGRMFDGGELKLVLLKLIDDAPRHGYDLIREIEERTGGAYAPSPGVIYPTLTLLDDMGLIEGVADGTKKQFAITDAGRAELDAKAAELTVLMDRLAELGAQRAKTDTGPVSRAMGNLRAVLANRVTAEGVTPETLHDIAALLDEVAQKVERL